MASTLRQLADDVHTMRSDQRLEHKENVERLTRIEKKQDQTNGRVTRLEDIVAPIKKTHDRIILLSSIFGFGMPLFVTIGTKLLDHFWK